MKNNIIFISNSRGGIKTFEDILIKYLNKKKIKCEVINNVSYKKNLERNINHYKIDV